MQGVRKWWNGLTGSLQEYTIEHLDLNRHWSGIERLLEMEEWPFIREDFEVSHHQERSIGVVACRGGEVKGFFVIHHFGDIAYLDMIIVERSERKNFPLVSEIWRRSNAEMETKGFITQVAHCTKDSAPLMRITGFKPGMTFTLLRRNPTGSQESAAPIQLLGEDSLTDIVDLDRKVFGMSRKPWLESLMGQRTAGFTGRRVDGALVASACLRTRRENSLCIDSLNGLSFDALVPLLEDIFAAFPHKRLECFVKTGSDLHRYLAENGFQMPDFFVPIGPLVEFRLGSADDVGTGPHVRTLSWI